MATMIVPNSIAFQLSANSLFFLLLIIFCSSCKTTFAFQGTKSKSFHHILHLNSLLQSAACNSSTQGLHHQKSSLQVVHKHGPCSPLHLDRAKTPPTHAETFFQDEGRVRYIQSRLANKSGCKADVKVTDVANLPAKDGRVVGSGNYIVTVGIGTPKKQLSLIFDTGSDITWTQCEPCLGFCYHQRDAKFDPSVSSTYSNVSCNSVQCSSLLSATGYLPLCSLSTCVYRIQYGDSSFSTGFFAKERLTLTPFDVFDNFLFGCGQNNQGLFGGAAGLLGLGRDQLSLPSQTARKYNKIFSYCLPSSSSSIGFLTLGKRRRYGSKSVKFTPLSTSIQDSSFYGLDITGISVGGKRLSISASVFTTAGAIIDSGTVITRLQPDAYAALRSEFRQRMRRYRMGRELSILDTCYDFSKYKSVNIPKISFFFRGGVKLTIPLVGTLYVANVSQVCLAFAANSDASDIAIFGNTQQKTLQVIYDGAGGRVGFGTKGCY
ncbi:hypothetical protein ES319_D05G063200v1 [Gossypium barbadense]|uniref:Peptidase A1 domain-containing protein n=1 Tax=Gossypium barbadense TaxID=3634 RepID=A0A5J5RDR4_GOSBA|nr:hypothetical protein ES319_D05G063200v1 [Gossypium barbadense]